MIKYKKTKKKLWQVQVGFHLLGSLQALGIGVLGLGVWGSGCLAFSWFWVAGVGVRCQGLDFRVPLWLVQGLMGLHEITVLFNCVAFWCFGGLHPKAYTRHRI